MTEPTCRWVSTTQPRVLPGRHVEDCTDDSCRGCQPCLEQHCRVCGVVHEVCCAGCSGEARTNLREIQRMCSDLPDEVEHKGVESEAFMLLGPAADAEAWGHHQASAYAGRIDASWLEQGDDDRHPLVVLGTWLMVWQDALEHDTETLVTVANAAAYLDTQLTYMAGYEHAPFEDFARDLRACASHLERVLHDGEQVDEGVPCMTCHKRLVRVWGCEGREDGWECRRCRTTSTEAQYQFAVKADYIDRAEWLTDQDMVVRTGVKAGTVRSWARGLGEDAAPVVRKRRDSDRTVYSVADVLAVARLKGLAA